MRVKGSLQEKVRILVWAELICWTLSKSLGLTEPVSLSAARGSRPPANSLSVFLYPPLASGLGIEMGRRQGRQDRWHRVYVLEGGDGQWTMDSEYVISSRVSA